VFVLFLILPLLIANYYLLIVEDPGVPWANYSFRVAPPPSAVKGKWDRGRPRPREAPEAR